MTTFIGDGFGSTLYSVHFRKYNIYYTYIHTFVLDRPIMEIFPSNSCISEDKANRKISVFLNELKP